MTIALILVAAVVLVAIAVRGTSRQVQGAAADGARSIADAHRWRCPACREAFETAGAMDQHMLSHARGPSAAQRPRVRATVAKCHAEAPPWAASCDPGASDTAAGPGAAQPTSAAARRDQARQAFDRR